MDDYAKYLKGRARLVTERESNYVMLLVSNLLLIITVLVMLAMIAFLLTQGGG
ncbi:MAG: hypothetical protein N2117_12725 [Anaerolineales bacterium]|nr:hypothetical protein [Anaerolineales bacterium]